MNTTACPCTSGSPYKECCGRYHAGQKPEDALVLMKSRYCAYVRKNIDYIVKTTHPLNHSRNKSTARWKQELAEFANNTQFLGLRIIEFVDGDKSATVTFTAYLMQADRDISFTEKSTFLKVKGQWLYQSGEIPDGVWQ